MKKILFAISLLLVLGSCSKSEKGSSWEVKHAVTAENVVPYYMDPRSEHKYVFGMSQLFEADKITAISLKEKSAKIIYRR